ncbi:MAG: V-type ATP synthase subunit E [Eubacterium sp.]|nr:V-type ATP synthase subunit E [Eubacterium sp.]
MAGIEKITNEINLEAKEEAAKIISSAEETAKMLLAKTEEECAAIRAEADEKLGKKLLAEDKKTQSQCEQVEKLIILKTKQDIIDSVINKAKNKLLLQDSDEYFNTLLKLLEKQAQADKGILFLNQKDLARIPVDFVTSAAEIAAKNGGELEFSKTPVDIDGGFVLKYGNIEINSSIDAIFDENVDELVDVCSKMLWT